MLRFAESLLDPTARPPEEPPTPEPPPGVAPGGTPGLAASPTLGPSPGSMGLRGPGSGTGLLRFYWHFIRQEKWLAVALFVCGGLIAMLDAAVPAFIGRIVSLVSTHTPATLLPATWPQFAFMAAVLLLVRPARVLLLRGIAQPDRQSRPDQHDPLAEPLACGPPELDLLPERLRRPHLQPRDADRAGDARKPGDDVRCWLVHRGLWQSPPFQPKNFKSARRIPGYTLATPSLMTALARFCEMPLLTEMCDKHVGDRRYIPTISWHYAWEGCSSLAPLRCGTQTRHAHLPLQLPQEWDQAWGSQTLIFGSDKPIPTHSAPNFDELTVAGAHGPIGNGSLLFQCTPHSWHGMKPLTCPPGKLRKIFSVTLNIVTSQVLWRRIRGKDPYGYRLGAA